MYARVKIIRGAYAGMTGELRPTGSVRLDKSFVVDEGCAWVGDTFHTGLSAPVRVSSYHPESSSEYVVIEPEVR